MASPRWGRMAAKKIISTVREIKFAPKGQFSGAQQGSATMGPEPPFGQLQAPRVAANRPPSLETSSAGHARN